MGYEGELEEETPGADGCGVGGNGAGAVGDVILPAWSRPHSPHPLVTLSFPLASP